MANWNIDETPYPGPYFIPTVNINPAARNKMLENIMELTEDDKEYWFYENKWPPKEKPDGR